MLLKKNLIPLFLLVVLLLPLYSQGAQEIQSVVDGTKSEDVELLMKSIHFLEVKIREIEKEHNQMWKEKKHIVEHSFYTETLVLNSLEPEIWETDYEFQQRKTQEEKKLTVRINKAIHEAEEVAHKERDAAEQVYINLLSDAYKNLSLPRIIADDYLIIEPDEYLRNERKWPLKISSTHSLVLFENLEVIIDFENLMKISHQGRDIRQEIIDFQTATHTGNIAAEVDWVPYRDEMNEKFIIGILEVRITNNINGVSYDFKYPDLLLTTAYQVVGTAYKTSLLHRVSVINDIQLTTAPQTIMGAQKISRFQIIPSNVLNKSLSYYVNHPELIEFNNKGFYVKAKNMEEVIFSVTADGGLFFKYFEIEKLLKPKKETEIKSIIAKEPVVLVEEEPVIVELAPWLIEEGYIVIEEDALNRKANAVDEIYNKLIRDEDFQSSDKPANPAKYLPKITPSPTENSKVNKKTQYQKHRGFGLGISAGYPAISLDLLYAFNNSRINLSYGWNIGTDLIITMGALFDVLTLEVYQNTILF